MLDGFYQLRKEVMCSLQLYHHYPFEHDISRDYFPQASECLPSEVSEAE